MDGKRKAEDAIEFNNASSFMEYLEASFNISLNPTPGENLVARLTSVDNQISILNQVQKVLNSGQRIVWGSYYDPAKGQNIGFTNRVAQTNLTSALDRLEGIKKDTESLNLSQLSAAATSVVPGDGDFRGDGNCYIQVVNIGQGDCTAIATPEGRTIMIDMGSDSMTDVKLNWPASGPPKRTASLNKIVVPIVLNDLRRDIFLGASNLINILILSHTDGDHHNKLGKLGRAMQFDRVYYSGNAITDYKASSNYIKARTTRGGIKKVDLKMEWMTDIVSKKINDVTPKTQSKSNKPGTYDNEYIDSTTGAIVLFEEASGFKISVLASNVIGVMFDDGQGKGPVWTSNDAEIKTSPLESKLKLNATEANKRSQVILVEYNGQRAIITGDATAVTEYFMTLQPGYKPLFKNLYMYRIPHHGSLTSSSFTLVDQMTGLGTAIASSSGKFTVLHRLPKENILQAYSSKKQAQLHQIWSFPLGPAGGKVQIAFKNYTFATGTNGTQIFKFT